MYPAHLFQCITAVYWATIGFYFINQLCALYIAFDTCVYICDMVVVLHF